MRSIILLVLTATAMSQDASSSANSTSVATTGDLCNSSISDANASGIITYDSLDPSFGVDAPDHSWAVTITGGSGQKLERQFWYDTAGKDYADDVGINTDVCAFPNFELPLNANRLGQHDPGNCSTMFTQNCIDSLTSAAKASALNWVTYSSPPPYENLTAGVLPTICRYIMNDLQETIKKECGPQLIPKGDKNSGFSPDYSLALTGYNSSALYYNNCTRSAGNKTLYPVTFPYPAYPGWDTGSDTGYDNLTNTVTPILTVYMDVANTERRGCCSTPKSVLECVRPSNFREGSRVAPALAEGTAWPKPGALSAGAKGGIAAGVVVFVLAVGGLLLYLWIAKRRKRALVAVAAEAESDAKLNDKQDLPPEADAGFGVHELTPKDRKHEVDNTVVSELSGTSGKTSELANTSKPVELPAERERSEP